MKYLIQRNLSHSTSGDFCKLTPKQPRRRPEEQVSSRLLCYKQKMPAPVRFAVVGIGHIARKAVLPAFARTRHAVCTAIISAQPDKLAEFPPVQWLHLRTIRSPPFAPANLTPSISLLPTPPPRLRDPRRRSWFAHPVRKAPGRDRRRLREPCATPPSSTRYGSMVAYRHRFSAAHQHALKSALRATLGELRAFHSLFTVNVRPEHRTHCPRAEGGGTLPDIGIYCLNSFRHFFGDEILDSSCSLLSRPDDDRFPDCEETCHVTLTFPGQRLATFTCAFGASRVMTYTIAGTKGSLHLDPVYEYTSDIQYLEVIEGHRRQVTFPKQDQFALQIDHFANAIQSGQPNHADGREAALDTQIIEDLYRKAVRLP